MPVSSSNMSLSDMSVFNFCFYSKLGNYVFTAFTLAAVVFLLPLLTCTLCVWLQRRWQQHSTSTSQFDHLIFHMAAMEIIGVFGAVAMCVGFYIDAFRLMMVSSQLLIISICGQMNLHCFACVERYVAVLHPIAYKHPKKGVIKDVIIFCVWFMALSKTFLILLNNLSFSIIVYIIELILSLMIVSLCSIAVLRVLRQPGVGGEVIERADQSKQRIFNTIMTIMITLLFKFGGNLLCTSLCATLQISLDKQCLLIDLIFWFGLPSSMALPLLFLRRAGKLPCFGMNTGQNK